MWTILHLLTLEAKWVLTQTYTDTYKVKDFWVALKGWCITYILTENSNVMLYFFKKTAKRVLEWKSRIQFVTWDKSFSPSIPQFLYLQGEVIGLLVLKFLCSSQNFVIPWWLYELTCKMCTLSVIVRQWGEVRVS